MGRNLPCSRIWSACKKGGPIYVKGLKWSMKNGLQVNLWLDFWLPNGTLRSLIEGPLTRDEDKVMLHQCFDIGTGWNLQNSSFVLPDQVLESMKATPFSCDTNSKDSLIWAYSKDGSFSLSSAYLLAKGLNPLNLDTVSLSWVWKTTTPPWVQFFIWLCMHNSLPIGEVLGSRGLNLNPIALFVLKRPKQLTIFCVHVNLHKAFGRG